jgi:dihydroneopterin aldolase
VRQVVTAGPVGPDSGPGMPDESERGADRIELRGLRLVCTVGVADEERARPQPIEIDLDLVLDEARGTGTATGSGPAGSGPGIGADDLARTADYSAVLDAVAAVAAGSSYLLLESLAEAGNRGAAQAAAPRALRPVQCRRSDHASA